MVRVSANDCQRQWGKVQDMALAEPVTITCKGRDRMVLMSADEYGRLKKRDRRVMTAADFSEGDIKALEQIRAPEEASAFNHEVNQ
jgi:prevent-host-death family protein